ncbi:hypothetical protein FRC07_005206 [Ceratobasidium sp. 392]|nr:hypothetical protein FRC07_005206 [Ceratobasidium sp. 392]
MTESEYYASIAAILPGCNPHDVNTQLTRFYEQFRAELQCLTTPLDRPHDSMVSTPQPEAPTDTKQITSALGIGYIAPKWKLDPDELRDKLLHLQCHLLRVISPDDDDCWARAARTADGLRTLLVQHTAARPSEN